MSNDDQKPAVLPRLNQGAGRICDLEGWLASSWLLAVELSSLVQDVQGQNIDVSLVEAVKLRMVEVLLQVEERMTGQVETKGIHALPQALQSGFREILDLPADAVPAAFSLGTPDSARVHQLWQRLLEGFPGELPDAVVASGQGAVLRALRDWSKACEAAGIDSSFLTPLLMDA